VLAIMISIYVLDPARRGKLWHLAACFLAAGLTADLIKLQVWRTRPRAYWEEHLSGSTFLGSIWTSDRLDWSSLLNHTHHSFPSAHTAVAVAVAMSLSRLYPLGRYWFMFLAGLCAMNRIDGGAHFASDVCWGAAVGYLIATVMPSPDRMETWMLRGGAKPTKSTAEERLGKAA
jgi:membrane-associated phospholipid phosphatase